MQFGHMIYEINPEGRDQDYEHIQEALYQARLAEELGYDAVWFAQHHFTGESAYGDPIVFATAVAMQTERVKLGFAVLEMATYHPVRVAVQTALLDNLSKGRLLVGTARGTRINAYEYTGFGTSVQKGIDSIDEAEDLLVKTWTNTEGLHYEGEHFQVTLPEGRPQTYQKPHPPLFRGAVSPQSVAEMGRRGRLVLFRSESAVEAREHVELYRKSMLEAGFDEAAVQQNLDQCWMWRDCYVAESDAQAQEEFTGGLERWLEGMGELRAQWNPQTPNMKTETGEGPLPVSAYGEHPDPAAPENFIGSPRRVTEQMEMLREAGVSNVFLSHLGGVVGSEGGRRSMRLLAEEVFPTFR
jgi:alkanesulfonate monooxygenase SsuD/methylene tetrahydromethanopterin reductase-like flavin-dependent oxidoreductase (luciferase family)